MAGTFKESLKAARQDFERHIRPLFKLLWPDCEIFSAEDQQDPLLKALDTCAGIDYLILHPEQQKIRALACRLQRYGMNYATFTIRYERESGKKTEYEKRAEAIAGGEMYPVLTLQGYLSKDGDKLLAAALVNTIDLYDYMRKYPSEVEIRTTGNNQFGQAKFKVVRWDKIIERYNVMVFEQKSEGLVMTYRNLNGEIKKLIRRTI